MVFAVTTTSAGHSRVQVSDVAASTVTVPVDESFALPGSVVVLLTTAVFEMMVPETRPALTS